MVQRLLGRSRPLLIFLLIALLSACQLPTQETTNSTEDGQENVGSETSGETVSEENETATETITTESGLQYTMVAVGDGETPKAGDIVSVHYTGKLEDGTVFDSSHSRGQPIQFPLGAGRNVIMW